MDLSKENVSAIQGLVNSEAWTIERSLLPSMQQKMPSSESCIEAARRVGESLNPPVAGSVVSSFLAVNRVERLKPLDESKSGPNVPILVRYREYASCFRTLPCDKALSFFCGVSSSAVVFARQSLEREGFEFEVSRGKYVEVIKRPNTNPVVEQKKDPPPAPVVVPTPAPAPAPVVQSIKMPTLPIVDAEAFARAADNPQIAALLRAFGIIK